MHFFMVVRKLLGQRMCYHRYCLFVKGQNMMCEKSARKKEGRGKKKISSRFFRTTCSFSLCDERLSRLFYKRDRDCASARLCMLHFTHSRYSVLPVCVRVHASLYRIVGGRSMTQPHSSTAENCPAPFRLIYFSNNRPNDNFILDYKRVYYITWDCWWGANRQLPSKLCA